MGPQPEKCHNCGGARFHIVGKEWVCDRCHPRPATGEKDDGEAKQSPPDGG